MSAKSTLSPKERLLVDLVTEGSGIPAVCKALRISRKTYHAMRKTIKAAGIDLDNRRPREEVPKPSRFEVVATYTAGGRRLLRISAAADTAMQAESHVAGLHAGMLMRFPEAEVSVQRRQISGPKSKEPASMGVGLDGLDVAMPLLRP